MKLRQRRGLLALPIALVTILVPSGQAMANSSACSQLDHETTTIRLLNSASTEGIRTHGIGVQVTIEDSSLPFWSFHSAGSGTYVIADSSGNCLRLANTDQATIANGCDENSSYQRWLPVDVSTSSAIACEFVNLQNGGYLKTLGDNTGDKVFVHPDDPGDYIKWHLFG